MSEVNLRRLFLKKCVSTTLRFAFIPILIESCGSHNTQTKKESKTVTTSGPCGTLELSEEDVKKRQSLGYVETAGSADRQCGNCNLWLPPADVKACGICQLFKGPVPPTASCTYWAPKV